MVDTVRGWTCTLPAHVSAASAFISLQRKCVHSPHQHAGWAYAQPGNRTQGQLQQAQPLRQLSSNLIYVALAVTDGVHIAHYGRNCVSRVLTSLTGRSQLPVCVLRTHQQRHKLFHVHRLVLQALDLCSSQTPLYRATVRSVHSAVSVLHHVSEIPKALYHPIRVP